LRRNSQRQMGIAVREKWDLRVNTVFSPTTEFSEQSTSKIQMTHPS